MRKASFKYSLFVKEYNSRLLLAVELYTLTTRLIPVIKIKKFSHSSNPWCEYKWKKKMQRRIILNGKSKLKFHCLEVTGVKIYTVTINLHFYSKEIEQTRQILSTLPGEIHGNFLFKQLP